MVDKTGVTFYQGAFVDVIKTVNRSGVWCMILADPDYEKLQSKNKKLRVLFANMHGYFAGARAGLRCGT